MYVHTELYASPSCTVVQYNAVYIICSYAIGTYRPAFGCFIIGGAIPKCREFSAKAQYLKLSTRAYGTSEDDDYGGAGDPTIFSLSGWLVGRGLHELGCGERGARKPSQSAGKSALLSARGV